jgi:hypothetical protein
MIVHHKMFLMIIACSLLTVNAQDVIWSTDQDLLLKCADVKQQFEDDTANFAQLKDIFTQLSIVLSNLVDYRQDSFDLYQQQLANYQSLLLSEQDVLVQLQNQAEVDQAEVQQSIDQVFQDGSLQVLQLQQSIQDVQVAIQALQENLATLNALDDSRVTAAQDMVNSYNGFESGQVDFKQSVETFLSVLRAYLGSNTTENFYNN